MDGGIGLSEFRKEDSTWKRVVIIRDCHIETQTEDNTVDILNGFLRLSGWLITMRMRKEPGREDHWEVFANGAWQKNRPPWVFLDGEIPTDQVHALPVVVDTQDNQPATIVFLLLHTTGDAEGRFYRIGVMYGSLENLGITG